MNLLESFCEFVLRKIENVINRIFKTEKPVKKENKVLILKQYKGK